MTRRMTEVEHKEVAKVFAGLWPDIANKLTDEQWLSWKRVWESATTNQAIRALRGLKDTSTKFPEPALLRKQIREERANEKQSGTTSNYRSWERHHITLMAEAMPDMQNDIDNMTERDMRMCLLFWELQMCFKVYGTKSRSTISAYWNWQKCVDINAPFSSWSPEAEQLYMQRFQNLEELEEKRPDMPKPSLMSIVRDFFRNQSALVA